MRESNKNTTQYFRGGLIFALPILMIIIYLMIIW